MVIEPKFRLHINKRVNEKNSNETFVPKSIQIFFAMALCLPYCFTDRDKSRILAQTFRLIFFRLPVCLYAKRDLVLSPLAFP